MMVGLLVLIGLVVGSFLNVLIWRLNEAKAPKFWQGRSLCPHCRHKLTWKENFPLLSFLFLRGRCRYCQEKISWQYPTVELLAAAVTVILGLSFNTLIAYAFIVIFFSDLIYGLIPDEMIILGVIFTGLGNFWVGLTTALPFFILARFKAMGYGDVKLAFLIGLLLGWPKVLVALWSGFILGGLVAVFLLILKKTRLSATIPLGPFLVLGIIISALWSDALIHLVIPFWN